MYECYRVTFDSHMNHNQPQVCRYLFKHVFLGIDIVAKAVAMDGKTTAYGLCLL